MHRIVQQRIARVQKYTQLDKLGGAQVRGEELHNEDIAKATSTSEKTFGARNLQGTTQGVLDKKRILRSVVLRSRTWSIWKQGGVYSELRVDVIARILKSALVKFI